MEYNIHISFHKLWLTTFHQFLQKKLSQITWNNSIGIHWWKRESYLFYGGNQRKRWLFSRSLNCLCVLIGIITNACSHHQLFPNHLFCCYWKVLFFIKNNPNKIVQKYKKSNRYKLISFFILLCIRIGYMCFLRYFLFFTT